MAAGFGCENSQVAEDVERKPIVVPKAATYAVADLEGVVEPTEATASGVDLGVLIIVLLRTNTLRTLKVVTRRRQWNLIIQSLVEKVLIHTTSHTYTFI